MTLTFAVLNADFTRGANRALFRKACDGADLLIGCEGTDLNVVDLLPDGWTGWQDTTDKGTRGSFLATRDAACTGAGFGVVHTSGPGVGLRRRHTARLRVTDLGDDRRMPVLGTHYPPRRNPFARRTHTRRLRELLAELGPVALGGDVNMDPSRAGRLLGLAASGAEVMALLSRGAVVKRMRVRHVGDLTDHPIVTFSVTFPEPKDPPMTTTITERVVTRARELGAVVYDRGEWGTAYPEVYAARRRERPVRVLQADTLVGHITVTRDDGTLPGEFFADMREVERIGMDRFGSGFSYNFGVDNDRGFIGVGMPLDAKGTHTVNDKDVPGYSYDQNHAARAIALIGMPGVVLSAAAREAWVILIAAMILEGALTDDPDVVPHSLFAAKDCPTDTVRDALPSIRRDALALVAKTLGQPTPDPAPLETNVTRARAALRAYRKAMAQANAAAEDAAALLGKTRPERTVARAGVDVAKDLAVSARVSRREAKALLEKLPPA